MEGNLVQKWIGVACSGKEMYHLLCFTLYLRAISEYRPLGGLYLEGRCNGAFFCVTNLGGLYLDGGAYFHNFTVLSSEQKMYTVVVNH